MAREKQYLVVGSYNGRRINEVVTAYTKRQAKRNAGWEYGFGREMASFLRSRKVKVRQRS